mgnify:CR=1 FL=1
MFLTVSEGVGLINGLAAGIGNSKADVMVAPSFTNLFAVSEAVKSAGAKIQVAAQNIYTEAEGAFTGEVSIPMVKSCGASAVILGHSERRNIFGETDALINTKVHKAIDADLTAVLCVGELLEERDAGVAVEVVIAQLGKSLKDVKNLDSVVIAYEPVWAIGTGKTASSDDAQAMHGEIRKFISRIYSNSAAEQLRILYGGSVKPENIAELMAQPDIDGALVGGASLKADSFLKIINY